MRIFSRRLATDKHKDRPIKCPLALLTLVLVATGCHITVKTVYEPRYVPTYPNVRKGAVSLANVTDRRPAKANLFYEDVSDGDSAEFDRPVAELVREAVVAELGRAELAQSNANPCFAVLDCEVLDLQATMTAPFLRGGTVGLKVVLRFIWKDPRTERELAANERSERRVRKLSFGNTPSLPFDKKMIRAFGNELINDMLPRVIEKEFNSVDFLSGEPSKLFHPRSAQYRRACEKQFLISRLLSTALVAKRTTEHPYEGSSRVEPLKDRQKHIGRQTTNQAVQQGGK